MQVFAKADANFQCISLEHTKQDCHFRPKLVSLLIKKKGGREQ